MFALQDWWSVGVIVSAPPTSASCSVKHCLSAALIPASRPAASVSMTISTPLRCGRGVETIINFDSSASAESTTTNVVCTNSEASGAGMRYWR